MACIEKHGSLGGTCLNVDPIFLGYQGLGAFQNLMNVSFSDHMLEGGPEIN